MATPARPVTKEEVTVCLARGTILLVKDLLEAWIEQTEWSHEVPVVAMRDWHRMRQAVDE